MEKKILFLTLAIIVLVMPHSAFGQTTEFTFQGRLLDNSLPPTASYDFEFRLFDAEVSGSELGSDSQLGVAVNAGVFSVRLDFGTQFDGTPRFLQIGVRPAGSPEPFTVLDPRQPISSTPYAIRSLNAAAAETAANSSQLGGVDAAEYVQDDDPRMTDERSPTAGSPNYVQNRTTQQAASNFNISGTGTASVFSAGTQFNISGSRILSSPGTLNTFVGINNGPAITSGERNTFVGRNTGVNTTTGSTNTFVGSGAGFENITGSQNSFFGYNAGLRVTSGARNSFFGVSAGSGNLIGADNSFFGYDAGLLATGNGNSFIGSAAGRSNTAGEANTFVGYLAGNRNTTGSQNTIVGVQAGQWTDVSHANSFFGYRAGDITIGNGQNSIFGAYAARFNQTGWRNTMFGYMAGAENTNGSHNTFFGWSSGDTNVTGDNNTLIGSNTDVASGNLGYATAIGADAVVSSSNTIALGRSAGQDTVVVPGNLSVGGSSQGLPFTVRTAAASVSALECGAGEIGISMNSTASDCSGVVMLRYPSGNVAFRAPAGDQIFFESGGATAFTITSNGYASPRLSSTAGLQDVCLNSQLVFSLCSSSARFKSNIRDLDLSLDTLERLRPVSFVWKDGGLEDIGLVAEEVEKVDPLLVTYNQDGEIQGVKYDRIGVVLINVVKEQQRQIDEQQEQIDALKAIVCDLLPDDAPCKTKEKSND